MFLKEGSLSTYAALAVHYEILLPLKISIFNSNVFYSYDGKAEFSAAITSVFNVT